MSVSTIRKFDILNGVIFVLVDRTTTVPLEAATEIVQSTDSGQTWHRGKIAGLADFLFEDAQKGLLVISGKLHRTEDGGHTTAVAFSPPSPLRRLRKSDSALVAISARQFYVSRDGGTNWISYTPPTPDEGGIELLNVEIGGGRIVATDNRLHIFMTREKPEKWTAWTIPGLVQGVAFKDGLFYIITSEKNQVRVLSDQSLSTIPIDADRGLKKLARFHDDLFCYGSDRFFLLSGPREFKTIMGPSNDLAVINGILMVSANEAICAKPGPSLGVGGKLVRVIFDPPDIMEMTVVP